jgi:hypothetical protein
VSALFVFLVNSTREKRKKFPLREKKGTKKNEEKRSAKRPSSSSFSAAKSDNNGTITSRARKARTREEVAERERDFALERGRRVAFFPERRAVFSPWGVRSSLSSPRASSSQSKRGHDREKRKQRRSETNAHLNGSCSVGVMTNPFSLISFNALVVLCF